MPSRPFAHEAVHRGRQRAAAHETRLDGENAATDAGRRTSGDNFEEIRDRGIEAAEKMMVVV